jgi:hypothetical protein
MPELTIARLIPPVGQCFHGSSRGLRQPAVAPRNNRTVELTKCLMEHDVALNRQSNPDVGSRNLEIASQIRTDDRVRGFSTAKGKKEEHRFMVQPTTSRALDNIWHRPSTMALCPRRPWSPAPTELLTLLRGILALFASMYAMDRES